MNLKRINTFLVAVIILINGYVIAAPFVPAILFRIDSHGGKRQQLEAKVRAPTKPSSQPASQQSNHIIIPSMLLETPIYDGPISSQYKTLDQGIWRWARGSTPDRGGNTVLIGHRFTYTNPRGVFYHLDKVKVGDTIGMIWDNKIYRFTVTSSRVMPPTDTSIEDPTDDSRLTLFTCTPLWLPKDRLVVVAKLETRP